MNTGSSGSSRKGIDAKKASPNRIGETKEKNEIEPRTNKDVSLLPSDPETTKDTSSSDTPTKEEGSKSSSFKEKKAVGEAGEVGSKRKGLSDTPPQAKKARTKASNASDDASDEPTSPGTASAFKATDDDTSLQAKVAATMKNQQIAMDVMAEEGQDIGGIYEQKTRTTDRRVPFPQVLYQLLEDDNYKDACCWLPDGLSFAIDPEIFRDKVVAVHFRGSKFDSFKRKLNRWGFRRVQEAEAPGTMTYYHRLFRRGYPGLLKQMNGGRIVAQKNKAPPADEQALLPPEASDQQMLMAAALMRGGIPTGLGPVMGLGGLMGAGATMSQFAPGDMDRILLEQERLRLELLRKSQEEVELRQKLSEEVYRRKAQEDQMRELLLSPQGRMAANAASSGQGLPSSQMPTGLSSTMQPGMTGQSFGGPQVAGFNPYLQGGAGLTQQSAAGTMMLDPSAPLEAPLPGMNELELAQFRNMNQQQNLDFERRVQEEMARRRSRGQQGQQGAQQNGSEQPKEKQEQQQGAQQNGAVAL